MSDDQQKTYYAIIPANVRYDNDLPPNAKLLYGEITALTNEKGYCWATNNYFAKLYGTSSVTVSRWIKSLKDKDYIKVEMIYREGTKEIDKRYIQICGEGINKNDNTPINKNDSPPINKNVKGNITYINNTLFNNTSNKYKLVKPDSNKYFKNDELEKIFIDFLDIRKKLKAVNSERAINTLLNTLSKYDDETKFKMIENSIANSWKGVFPLKENKKSDRKPIRQEQVPEWMKKEIKREQMPEDELKQLKKDFEEFQDP